MKLNSLIPVATLVVLLSACTSAPPRQAPLPERLANEATVLGLADVRTWSDATPTAMEAWYPLSEEEVRKNYHGIVNREHHYLALSGGGENGAFTAGLLAGWSAAGDRPEFTLVTGVSTGALIAPYAFLGPDYDAQVKEVYTGYAMEDLIDQRGVFNIVRNDAVAESTPMQTLINKHMQPEVMKQIAQEWSEGRMLLIATTNIDAGRPVIWDIGRIAASGHPGSLELIRNILLASASIPVGVPPVVIDVEAGGRDYQELHVDGGVTEQVFLYPPNLDWSSVVERLGLPGRPNVYIIRNAYVDPDWEVMERRLIPLASRTIDSLIRTQGIGDLYRIYVTSQRDEMTFNLAYISAEFGDAQDQRSGLEYMRKLYDFAFDQARRGYPWHSAPPGMREAGLVPGK